MHRFDQHEPAELRVVDRFPNNEPRFIWLFVRGTGDEVLLCLIFKIRKTFAGSERGRRVIDRTGLRNLCGNRWQRDRRRSLRKVCWGPPALTAASTLSTALSLRSCHDADY